MEHLRSTQTYRAIGAELAAQFAPRAAEWDKSRSYPWPNVAAMTDAGLMGMTIPKAFGGQGASFFDVVTVVEEVAKACTLSARILVEVKNGLLPIIIDEVAHQWLLDHPGEEVSVDLEACALRLPKNGGTYRFEIDEFSRHCLMQGVDEMGYLQAQSEAINKFEQDYGRY